MQHDIQRMQVYNRSKDLACGIILITDKITPFRLAEQIAGSVISIPSNLSEGAERGQKEFIRFIEYARGSAAELATQLQIAIETSRYDEKTLLKHLAETQEIRKMLYAFQAQLKKKLAG